MSLSPFGIKNAERRERPYKLFDGGGLYLLVQPNGSKLWRMKFRFHGNERLISFGRYPIIGLAEARTKRDDAKRLIAAGTDPSVQRKLDRIASEAQASNTFGILVAEYLENLKENGAAEVTVGKNRWLLENLAGSLSTRPIAEITSAELLDLLKRIEKSGRRESARRLRGVIGGVFRLAIVTLRANNDPTFALRGALLRPKVQHRPAIVDEKKLGALKLNIDEYDGWPTLTAALKLVSLTMCRPGDVRGMCRQEINFEKALWRIPAERTKMRRPHDVPLSKQALEVLRDIWSLSDHGELVFPSIRSARKPLSENAFNSALRRMGYAKDEMTAHGFRSSASTILNERGFSPDVIEAALGHQDENAIRRAYNRATYWPERVTLMQTWADLLDEFAKNVGKRMAA